MAVDFHSLTISRIDPQTDDSVAISLAVPDELADRFTHTAGQHLVVRAEIGGEDVRRSYSICSPVGKELRIGVKRIPAGVFSTWATTSLAPGDTLQVLPPIGEFTLAADPAAPPARRVAFAAGSGITPVLSMIATALAAEPDSEFTLVYGNRTTRTIMFLEDIEALKNRYPDRFRVIHILSREPHQVPLFQGRIDADKIRAMAGLLGGGEPLADIAGWYLCGPLDLVETAAATLTELGVGADRIHSELFFDQRIEPVPEPEDDAATVQLDITLDGRTSSLRIDPNGPPLLDWARSARAEVPFACKGGMCATCKARVIEGEVTMAKNYALTDDEVDGGYVLTCQAHPAPYVSRVALSFDVHGGVGR